MLDHPFGEGLKADSVLDVGLKSDSRVIKNSKVESTAEGIDVPTHFNQKVEASHSGYKAGLIPFRRAISYNVC